MTPACTPATLPPLLPSRPERISPATIVGAWSSQDGAVKLRLRADGTYAGTVAGRRRRPRGTYRIDGAAMVLRDNSGLDTPVQVYVGELEMAGHRLLPE